MPIAASSFTRVVSAIRRTNATPARLANPAPRSSPPSSRPGDEKRHRHAGECRVGEGIPQEALLAQHRKASQKPTDRTQEGAAQRHRLQRVGVSHAPRRQAHRHKDGKQHKRYRNNHGGTPRVGGKAMGRGRRGRRQGRRRPGHRTHGVRSMSWTSVSTSVGRRRCSPVGTDGAAEEATADVVVPATDVVPATEVAPATDVTDAMLPP